MLATLGIAAWPIVLTAIVGRARSRAFVVRLLAASQGDRGREEIGKIAASVRA